MATFPPYVKLGWRDHAEKPTPVVVRSEMERGVARQRRTHADSLVTVPVTAYFDTAADSLAFETWFFGDAGAGTAWFDFTLPRTNAVTQARVVGGDIGSLKPSTKNWAFSERTFQLEYVRPGFVQLAPGLQTVDASRILSVQRNSTATYIDDNGVLQTAAANVARYEGGQLLVEGEATNLTVYSEMFSNAAWVKNGTTVTTDAVVGPNLLGAAKLVESAAAGAHGLYGGSGTVVAGLPYCAGFFVKAGGRNRFRLTSYRGDFDVHTIFDCSTGAVFYSTAEEVFVSVLVDGWFRVSHRFTGAVSGGSVYRCQAYLQDSSGNDTYVGNGSAGLYIFGAQVTEGAIPFSYTPTTTAPATRAADIITVAA